MTDTATVLPTGFVTEIDGAAALVVGYVHGFPRHPARGALVQPFTGAHCLASATGVIGAPLYALVSVEWATPVTTVECDGTSRTQYVKGWLGTPQGTSWYLHPAVYDYEMGLYALAAEDRYAASGREAAVPADARAAVQAWGFGGPDGVPASVRVHNFPV
ncbi:hypothetical protein [Prescottella agglutinans]|uniref:Uncharacterized protein n=1 Tax=Prescottella agglutinans TaxID=1644129 RepID=A0ABT6ML60_9NOCA|nr:hypothetical protein [Prescottella agglutinans]MDH6284496.1 hypothetical protein [Prescottella agglutinans]